MTHSHSRIAYAAALILLLATMMGRALAGDEPAARIEFIFGSASIVSTTGESRPAEKGSPVFVGDTVITDDARAQLRFTDGGFVGLLPRSEFRVNAYTYSGSPEDDRISMTLLKGGLRTISGIVGKVKQSAYEMITMAATIGIRGTEYTVLHDESITGSVGNGRIAVCNAAGCIEVGAGQAYYVKDQDTKPVFTNKAAFLPPPQPDSGRSDTAEVDSRKDSRLKSGLHERGMADIKRGAFANPGRGAGNNGSGGGFGTGGGWRSPVAIAAQGIGFELIGSTAHKVVGPVQRISDLPHQNVLPDQSNGGGYGKGGNPK